MSSYILHSCSDKKQWDDFASASPQGNLFCQTRFLDSFRKEYELLMIVQGNENLLGAVVVKDKVGQPTTKPFMYQGVLFDRSLADYPNHRWVKKSLELVDFLLAKLDRCYNRICFSLHHSFNDVRSFQWFNY